MRHTLSVFLGLVLGGLCSAQSTTNAGELGEGISFIEPLSASLLFPPHPPTGQNVYGIATGDFNGDRKLDLAVTAARNDPGSPQDGFVYIMLGNGNGLFRPPVGMQIPRQSNGQFLERR